MDNGGTGISPAMIVLLVLVALVAVYVLYRIAKARRGLKRDTGGYSPEGLVSDDYGAVAAKILEGLGGKGNVVSAENCITRLRIKIKDYTEVDEKKIRDSGAPGVMRPDKNSVHIIVGKNVKHVADELKKLL